MFYACDSSLHATGHTQISQATVRQGRCPSGCARSDDSRKACGEISDPVNLQSVHFVVRFSSRGVVKSIIRAISGIRAGVATGCD